MASSTDMTKTTNPASSKTPSSKTTPEEATKTKKSSKADAKSPYKSVLPSTDVILTHLPSVSKTGERTGSTDDTDVRHEKEEKSLKKKERKKAECKKEVNEVGDEMPTGTATSKSSSSATPSPSNPSTTRSRVAKLKANEKLGPETIPGHEGIDRGDDGGYQPSSSSSISLDSEESNEDEEDEGENPPEETRRSGKTTPAPKPKPLPLSVETPAGLRGNNKNLFSPSSSFLKKFSVPSSVIHPSKKQAELEPDKESTPDFARENFSQNFSFRENLPENLSTNLSQSERALSENLKKKRVIGKPLRQKRRRSEWISDNPSSSLVIDSLGSLEPTRICLPKATSLSHQLADNSQFELNLPVRCNSSSYRSLPEDDSSSSEEINQVSEEENSSNFDFKETNSLLAFLSTITSVRKKGPKDIADIPQLQSDVFQHPSWIAMQAIHDANLVVKDQVNTWMSTLGDVIKTCESKTWYRKNSWASLAKLKVVHGKSQKLMGLISGCYFEDYSWKDFRVVLRREFSPQSEVASEHFTTLLDALQKTHPVVSEVTMVRVYANGIFDQCDDALTELKAHSSAEESQLIEYIFNILRNKMVQKMTVDLLLSLHKSLLNQWDKQDKPLDIEPMELSQWFDQKYSGKVKVLGTSAALASVQQQQAAPALAKPQQGQQRQQFQGRRGKHGGGGQKRPRQNYQSFRQSTPPPIPQPVQQAPPVQPTPQPQARRLKPLCNVCGNSHFGKCHMYLASDGNIYQIEKKARVGAVQVHLPPPPPLASQQPPPPPPPAYAYNGYGYYGWPGASAASPSSSSTQQPPTGACMLSEIGVVKDTTLGGGTMIVINTTISHSNRLIPARIWLDTGSSITLISKKFLTDNRMNCSKYFKNFVLQGINSVSVRQESFVCSFNLLVNKRDIKITALVSDSTLFDHTRDILLGQDVISNKLGALLSCSSSKPIVWAKEDEPYHIIQMLERSLSNVGRAKEASVSSGAWANTSIEARTTTSPDSIAAVDPSGLMVTESFRPVEVQPPLGNPSSANSAHHDSEENDVLNESNLSGDRADIDDKSSSNHSKKKYNMKKREKQTRKIKRNKRSTNNKKRKIARDTRACRRKLNKEFKEKLKDNFYIRYNLSEIPSRVETNDIVSAVLDHRQIIAAATENAVSKFRALQPQYSKQLQGEAVAALEAVMKQSAQKLTSVDWNELPERDEIFIHHSLTDVQQKQLNDLVEEYRSQKLFMKTIEKYGDSLLAPFDIELTDGGEEYLSKRRPRAYALKGEGRELMKKSMEEMAASGVGILNPNYLLHASPAFFVKKARSTKLRLCYGCVDLNKVSKDYIYPLPLMTDILDKLLGKKYFTLLDLKSGYWQVRLTDRAKRLVGMITQLGTFGWNVLPFGPKNGPPHFQREMRETLGELLDECALVYIDDIIIFSDTFEEHIVDVAKC
jgi:hypothetical protein